MADLIISFDPGASLSRVFFTLDSSKPELLLMEPYTALIPKQSLLSYEEDAIGISSGLTQLAQGDRKLVVPMYYIQGDILH
ncbi:MAG: hypothetical protein RMZ69_20205 [Nostoc sp. ChiQUE01a]|nr:hypothetical protein [Nostoc sp. ChiQUE01a]